MTPNKKPTLISFRCPICGAGVLSAVNPFSVESPLIRLRCSCGESQATLEKVNENTTRVTLPCLICPTPHTYTLQNSLFNREFFDLTCPYGNDVRTFFAGDADIVKAKIAEDELELLKNMEEQGISSFADLHQGAPAPDPVRLQGVLTVLSELEAEKKIFCDCGNEEEKDLVAEVMGDRLRVSCKKCQAFAFIPCDDSLASESFLDADRLTLRHEDEIV